MQAATVTSLDVLSLATAIEGHPDNAAAAIMGGIACGCQQDDGRVLASAWRWPEAVRFVAATPAAQVETGYARSVLPASIPMKDAVFNLQRALLLVRALESGRFDLIREAIRDRWHQSVRARFVPALSDALALEHPGLLGVCLAGSGPSVVALVTGHDDEIAAVAGGALPAAGRAVHDPPAQRASARARLTPNRYAVRVRGTQVPGGRCAPSHL